MSKIDKQCVKVKLHELEDRIDALQQPTLLVVKQPLYEYRDVWAEEGGVLNNNSAQWSYGNGATGFMGLPIMDDGWEVTHMYFHADTYAANTAVEVALCDYTTPSNAAANILATIALSNSVDGFGATNNAAKYVELSPYVPVPNPAILGFRTISRVGTASDVRVGVRLRRQIGEYVSDVSIA